MRLYALTTQKEVFAEPTPIKLSTSLDDILLCKEEGQDLVYLDLEDNKVYTISQNNNEEFPFDWKVYDGSIVKEVLYNPDTKEELDINEPSNDSFFLYYKVTTYENGEITEIEYQ